MKRVVSGVAYDTNTAAKLVSNDWDDRDTGGTKGESMLYQTRRGAFFAYIHEMIQYKDRFGAMGSKERNGILPLTHEQAQRWITAGGRTRAVR